MRVQQQAAPPSSALRSAEGAGMPTVLPPLPLPLLLAPMVGSLTPPGSERGGGLVARMRMRCMTPSSWRLDSRKSMPRLLRRASSSFWLRLPPGPPFPRDGCMALSRQLDELQVRGFESSTRRAASVRSFFEGTLALLRCFFVEMRF